MPRRISLSKRLRGWGRRQRLSLAGVNVASEPLWISGGYESWGVSPARLPRQPLIYSFGIGRTLEWELELIQKFGAEVHAFDPTPASVAWLAEQSLPPSLHAHAWGLSAKDGDLLLYPPKSADGENFTQEKLEYVSEGHSARAIAVPVKRALTTMRELKHEQLDLLKIDVEGAEFEAIPEMLSSGVRPGQLMLELHYHYPTRSFKEGLALIRTIEGAGYRCSHISQRGLEFSFVRASVGCG
jgi:FkbM family methyltransferase